MSDKRPFSAPPPDSENNIHTNDRLSPEMAKRLFKEPIFYKNVLINTFTLASESFDTRKLIDNAFIDNVFRNDRKNLVERIDADYPHSFSTEFIGVSRTNTPIGDEPLLSNIRVAHDVKDEITNFIIENNIPCTDDGCIVLCKHQEGSRFLQKRLETYSVDEYLWFFNVIKYRVIDLSIDLFGNYVIQKIFETAHLLDENIGIHDEGMKIWQERNRILDERNKEFNNQEFYHKSPYTKNSSIRESCKGKNAEESGNNYSELRPLEIKSSGNGRVGRIRGVGFTIINELVELLRGKILILSLHMYGCRVIQKALECIEDATPIIEELKDDITTLIEDQNGNHVVQKCVERLNDRKFLIAEFESNYIDLCNHKYGCRVIQRLFEACESDSSSCERLVKLIIDDYDKLIVDQYGNYVLQHIIERHPYKRRLIKKILPKSYTYSLHKFASNVIEKCVAKEPHEYFLEFIRIGTDGKPFLIEMATDKFANYVVQRIFEFLGEGDKKMMKILLQRHIGELKKNGYAKHIVSKIM